MLTKLTRNQQGGQIVSASQKKIAHGCDPGVFRFFLEFIPHIAGHSTENKISVLATGEKHHKKVWKSIKIWIKSLEHLPLSESATNFLFGVHTRRKENERLNGIQELVPGRGQRLTWAHVCQQRLVVGPQPPQLLLPRPKLRHRRDATLPRMTGNPPTRRRPQTPLGGQAALAPATPPSPSLPLPLCQHRLQGPPVRLPLGRPVRGVAQLLPQRLEVPVPAPARPPAWSRDTPPALCGWWRGSSLSDEVGDALGWLEWTPDQQAHYTRFGLLETERRCVERPPEGLRHRGWKIWAGGKTRQLADPSPWWSHGGN